MDDVAEEALLVMRLQANQLWDARESMRDLIAASGIETEEKEQIINELENRWLSLWNTMKCTTETILKRPPSATDAMVVWNAYQAYTSAQGRDEDLLPVDRSPAELELEIMHRRLAEAETQNKEATETIKKLETYNEMTNDALDVLRLERLEPREDANLSGGMDAAAQTDVNAVALHRQEESAEKLARCEEELQLEREFSTSLQEKIEMLTRRYRRKKELIRTLHSQVEELEEQVTDKDDVILSLQARVATLKAAPCSVDNSNLVDDEDVASTNNPGDSENGASSDDHGGNLTDEYDGYPRGMHRSLDVYRVRAETEEKKVTPWPGTKVSWKYLFDTLKEMVCWRYDSLRNDKPKTRYKSFQSTSLALLAFYITFGVQHVTGSLSLLRNEEEKVGENIAIIAAELEKACGDSIEYGTIDELVADAKKHVHSIWDRLRELRRNADNVWSDPSERESRSLHCKQKQLYEKIFVNFIKEARNKPK